MRNSGNTQATGGGIGFTTLLLLAFIVLKLCGVITWSWLWVLSPVWIPIVLAIVIILSIVVINEIGIAIRKNRNRKN